MNLNLFKYLKEILFLLRLALLLNKYINLLSSLVVLSVDFIDMKFNSDLFINLTTDDNYKVWLRRIAYITLGVVGFYILYKFSSNGGADVVISTEKEISCAGPIISKHW